MSTVNLQKEISNLKSTVNENRRSQNEMNTKFKVDLELIKLKDSKVSKLTGIVRYLVSRYREQKAQIDMLVRLLNGKWQPMVRCECGRQVNCMSPSKCGDIDNLFNYHDNQDESDNTSQTSHESTKRKSRRRRNRRKTGEKKDPHANIDAIPEEFLLSTNKKPILAVSRCTYTEEHRARISQIVPQCGKWGPLECLNNSGVWHFKLADHLGPYGKWNRIVEKRNVGLYSRFVLLPLEMAGMTVILELWGLPDSPADDFKLRLFAPVEVKENLNITLPLKFSLVAEMKLQNGQTYRSHQHEFHINKLACYAEPDTFCIPFANTDLNKLPDIRLEFL